MRTALLFFLVALNGAEVEAFPGKRLFGKLKDKLAARKARGKKSVEKTAGAAADAGSCDAPSYPPGALSLLTAATDLYTKTFGSAPTLAAHAPGDETLC